MERNIFTNIVIVANTLLILVGGVFLYKQQKQISFLLNPSGVNKIDEAQLKKIAQNVLEEQKAVAKKDFIASYKQTFGEVKSISGDGFVVEVQVPKQEDLEKIEDYTKPLTISNSTKQITVKKTANTVVTGTIAVGDFVNVYANVSIVGLDSFEAIKIELIPKHEPIKVENVEKKK